MPTAVPPLLLRPWSSITPTFAACAVFVDNARWDGVPFLLKAGKALHSRVAEIRVQVRAAVVLLPGFSRRSAGGLAQQPAYSPPDDRQVSPAQRQAHSSPDDQPLAPALPTVPPCAGQPVPQQAGPGPGPRHQRAGGLCRLGWVGGWVMLGLVD